MYNRFCCVFETDFTSHLTVPNFESAFQNSVQSFKFFQALSIQALFKVQEKIHILNLHDHFRENFASLKYKNLAKYWKTWLAFVKALIPGFRKLLLKRYELNLNSMVG